MYSLVSDVKIWVDFVTITFLGKTGERTDLFGEKLNCIIPAIDEITTFIEETTCK